MAINLNHQQFGSQFQEFVDLATRNAADPDTIVCLDDRERGRAPNQLLGPNGEARLISVKDGDTIRPLLGAHFGRSADNKALNNQIRNLFLETVLKICGVRTKEELPETVRTAMKLKDYDNKGHPLTVRRITAVKAAIEAKFQADADVALEKITSMLDKTVVAEGNADREECAARARTLVEATKGDAELLELLTSKKCHLAKMFLCKGKSGDELCSYEEVVNSMNHCRNAIKDLRAATDGDRRLYERSLKLLDEFVKHPLQPGQITRMAAAVRAMDLDPVKNLLLAPGHANKFEAVCRIQKMVNSALAQALVQVDGEGDEAQEKLYASYCLLYDIIFQELGRNALNNLRLAMNGEPFRIELRATYDMTQAFGEEAANDEPLLKTEIRRFADSVSYIALYSLIPFVRDALGGQDEFTSFVHLPENVTADQRRPVYEMIKGIVQEEDVQPNLIEA